MTVCISCGDDLIADDGNPDTDYQFDNALWVGFWGGYGMFVDNIDARMPTNSDERWIRNSDERDEFGLYCDFARYELTGELIDNPEWKPEYREQRLLPGQPDYEAVICHDCAHWLCDRIPWIGRLLQPFRSHAHRTEWMATHPGHWGWDYARQDDDATR